MTLPKVAWSEQFRRSLERPFGERSLLWQLGWPALTLAAFLYGTVMGLRRRVLLAGSRRPVEVQGARGVRVVAQIAIGNFAVGGSGKSPLVHHLALTFLRKGHPVIVLSRGYDPNPETPRRLGVYAGAWDQSHTSRLPFLLEEADLSDELRELVVALRLKAQGVLATETLVPPLPPFLPPFLIAQDPNRSRGLAHALEVLAEFPAQAQGPGAVVLMDDALQHLQCPRDLEICVWSVSSALRAPRAPIPLGIYREGMGSGLNRLASRVPVHVWNGEDPQESLRALARLGPFPSDTLHVEMRHTLRWMEVRQTEWTVVDPLEPFDITGATGRVALIVTGIAAPQRFVSSVTRALERRQQATAAGGDPARPQVLAVHFRDHGRFEVAAVRRATQGREVVVFLTLKDWCRWRGTPEFEGFVADHPVVVGVLEPELALLTSAPSAFSSASAGDAAVGLVDLLMERMASRSVTGSSSPSSMTL